MITRLFSEVLGSGNCEVCGRAAARPLCNPCRAELVPAGGCSRCGDYNCPGRAGCNKYWMPFTSVSAAVALEGPARVLVDLLKTRGPARVSDLIADQIIERAIDPAAGYSFVTWVPAGPNLSERGFDQGHEIALRVASRLGLKSKSIISRQTQTDQRKLGREDRYAAAAGAFRLRRQAIEGSVLIVDDVTTTGATLFHAALLLREGGAYEVGAAAFARTIRTVSDTSGQDSARWLRYVR